MKHNLVMRRLPDHDVGSELYTRYVSWFAALSVKGQDMRLLKWQMNVLYINIEAILRVAGLSRIYDKGKNSWPRPCLGDLAFDLYFPFFFLVIVFSNFTELP